MGIESLENLRKGESVVMILRRHRIIFIMLGLYALLGLIGGIFVYVIITGYLGLLLSMIFLMGYSIFIYIEWLNHELDMYIITNNRIIGVEQIKFLDRRVSETNLGQVQEVNHRTKGIFANLLNYGTIVIQTAGNMTTLKMDFCPDALINSRKILNVADHYKDSKQDNAPIKVTDAEKGVHSFEYKN